MHKGASLTELAGRWSGSNRLWFMPGDPVSKSQAKASVVSSGLGALTVIAYTWAYEGKPQEGTLMMRAESDQDDVQVVWFDTWHTNNKFMMFRCEDDQEGLVVVRCTYAVPPGPDRGWRIVLGADSADEFRILMHNITPDGEEMLAVDTRYRRADAK